MQLSTAIFVYRKGTPLNAFFVASENNPVRGRGSGVGGTEEVLREEEDRGENRKGSMAI